jgi:hypothetical protein
VLLRSLVESLQNVSDVPAVSVFRVYENKKPLVSSEALVFQSTRRHHIAEESNFLKQRCFLTKKGEKTSPVTCRGGSYICETSWLPHFLENQLTDGGKGVRLTRRPDARYPPGRFLILISVKRLSRLQSHCAVGSVTTI